MARKTVTIAMLAAGLLALAGCVELGPQFQKIDTIPDEMALVYIYRPSSFIGGGVSYDVYVDRTIVNTLYNGGYYPYFTKPGEIEFWAETEAKSSVTLDVKAGQVYYIRGTVGVGFFIGRPHLTVVPAEVAEPEIAECKLVPGLAPKKE